MHSSTLCLELLIFTLKSHLAYFSLKFKNLSIVLDFFKDLSFLAAVKLISDGRKPQINMFTMQSDSMTFSGNNKCHKLLSAVHDAPLLAPCIIYGKPFTDPNTPVELWLLVKVTAVIFISAKGNIYCWQPAKAISVVVTLDSKNIK